MNPVLFNVERGERRVLLKTEARNRVSGAWGAWETIRFPKGTIGTGWSYGFDKIHRNRIFGVLDRTLDSGVRHFAVSSLSNIRPNWHEMQRIKNDLAGREATAIEVYPPANEMVDEADMFHIWVLTEPLPFGLSVPPLLKP